MNVFKEKFNVKDGVRLYKEDLIELEKLLKYEDALKIRETKYLECLTDVEFLYRMDYPKEKKKVKTFKSPTNLTIEEEYIDIDALYIKKTITEKGSPNKFIDITVTKYHAEIKIEGDESSWVNYQKYLLERFFKRRKPKLGKYNEWVSKKLHWYSSVLAGILGGLGIGFTNPTLVIVAGILLIISGIIAYPYLKHKLFPLNEIGLRNGENIKETQDSRFIKWVKNGVSGVIIGLITYLITKIFE